MACYRQLLIVLPIGLAAIVMALYSHQLARLSQLNPEFDYFQVSITHKLLIHKGPDPQTAL